MNPIAIFLLSLSLVSGLLHRPALLAVDCSKPVYVIRAGDTLATIAETCDIPYTVILGINFNLKDPNRVRPGQQIRLQAEAILNIDTNPAVGPPAEGGQQPEDEYIVRPGDSLARISYLYGISLSDLRALNPKIGPNNLVFPGQTIRLLQGAAEINKPTGTGFVGVPAATLQRGVKHLINISSFPAYTQLDVRLKRAGSNHPTVIYDAKTDALGNAFIYITFPFNAQIGAHWVVEVVTSEIADPIKATSAVVTIR